MSGPAPKARPSAGNISARTPGTSLPVPPDATLASTLKEVQDGDGAVRSLKEAKSYLLKNAWMLSEDDFTLERAAVILLTISRDNSKTSVIRNALATRAIGFILTDPALAPRSDSLNATIETIVSSAVNNTVQTIEARLSTQITFLSKATSETAETLVQLKSAVDTQNTSLSRLHELDNKLATTTESMDTQIKSYKDALKSQTPAQGAANNRLPNANTGDSAIRKRMAMQDRQLMIVFRPITDEFKTEFDKLPLDELKQKAIDLVGEVAGSDATSQTLDIRVRGATMAKDSRSILIEFFSEAAPKWLRGSDAGNTLLRRLGNEEKWPAIFKNRIFPVFLQFVSVDWEPTLDNLRQLEARNDLEPNSVIEARWVKNPKDRAPGQRSAHLRLWLRSPKDANKLLTGRIYVANSMVYAKKVSKEPIRCAKCFKFGHMAAHCGSITQDVCAYCSGAHRIQVCKRDRPAHCVNCAGTDHAYTHTSTSRACPEFKRRCLVLDSRCPENLLQYYPTDEDWTWAWNGLLQN